MSATIIQIRPDETTDKQIDNYIVDRIDTIFTKVFGIVNPHLAIEEILTIEEACKFLRDCSVTTLNGYTKIGLKKHKAGQKVYYLRKEILEFIATLPPE